MEGIQENKEVIREDVPSDQPYKGFTYQRAGGSTGQTSDVPFSFYDLHYSPRFINESKFKRYKTKLDGLGNAMTIRTLQEGRRNTINAPWNHNVPDTGDSEDDQGKNRNTNKAPKGRVTQRVGMFRNAKQSQIIYNNVSTAVRKMVDRDIEELVAPESEVQWAPNIPNMNTVAASYRNRNEEYMDKEGPINQGPIHRRIKRKDEYLQEDVMDALSKRKRYAELVKDLSLGPSNDPGCFRLQPSDFVFSTPVRPACVASDENYYHVDSNNNTCNSNNNINKNVDSTEKLPYPSELLSKRMLTTLPTLCLRDDERKDYDTTALNMMTESIRRSATSSSSESKMLTSFMNKTQAMNISCDESRDFVNDPEANQHEFLIPTTPTAGSSSPPSTPPLEREFNQTIVFPVFNAECNEILTPRVVPANRPVETYQDIPNAEAVDGVQGEILYSYDELEEKQLAESHYATEAVANFWPFEEESTSGQETEPENGYNWMNAWEEKSSFF
ncbi:unnamed protein product [Auanema sp. JU1783]|nr:unnamed protein product [Auanema sp. JU1783]